MNNDPNTVNETERNDRSRVRPLGESIDVARVEEEPKPRDTVTKRQPRDTVRRTEPKSGGGTQR